MMVIFYHQGVSVALLGALLQHGKVSQLKTFPGSN